VVPEKEWEEAGRKQTIFFQKGPLVGGSRPEKCKNENKSAPEGRSDRLEGGEAG